MTLSSLPTDAPHSPTRREPGFWLVLAILGTFAACGTPSDPGPVAPDGGKSGPLASASAAAGPSEEEILGMVYDNKTRITTSTHQVRLTQEGQGACIYEADDPGACLVSQTMQVVPTGSRPGKDFPMWGWFNSLDSDDNPCELGNPAVDMSERHSLDGDTIPDAGFEKHCVKPGRYLVELLLDQLVVRRRTVDHFLTTPGLFIDNRAVEDSQGGPANDTFVHFDLNDNAVYDIQDDTLAIDDPGTPDLFAPGDTLVEPGTRVRALHGATTPLWDQSVLTGRLMSRVFFDHLSDPTERTEYWNPDEVIRTWLYDAEGAFGVRAETAVPPDPDDVGVLSPPRTVVVQSSGPPPVATVSVSPSSATLTSQGETVQLSATLRDADGNVLTGRPVAWSSSNPSVATVSDNDDTAIVTAQSEGFATVTATSEGVSDQASITVDFPPEPTTVVVSPSSPSIEVGEQQQFSALVFDGSGNRMFDAEQALAWTSSNPSVATMQDASGPVASAVGQGGGTTTIRAQVEGVSDTASLQVTVPPPPVDDAAAISNSLPTQISQGQFVAVSVTMKNTGTTTWTSGGGYDLRRVSGGFNFIPASASLGFNVVDPGETEPIPFNLSSEASPGDYLVEYQMKHNGQAFGDPNGRTITVVSGGCTKNCELAGVYGDEGPVPGGALDGGREAAPAGADEVVQRLEVDDYRLRQVTADGRGAKIEYYGALSEPWGVDVTFRLESDPGRVAPGVVRRSIQLTGYEVEVESDGPGVTLVHLKRVREDAALPAGELLLLEIPLVSPGSERLPERLTRVELIARQ